MDGLTFRYGSNFFFNGFFAGVNDRIGANSEQFLHLFFSADYVDGAKTDVSAKANDHPPQGAARGRLQEPGAARHFQDILRHDERAGGIDEEGGHLLIGNRRWYGNHLLGGDDDLFLPIAAFAVQNSDTPPEAQLSQETASGRFHDSHAFKAGSCRQRREPTVLTTHDQ